MLICINRETALALAAQAAKAVPKTTATPEIKGIHLQADARLSMVTMTATDGEISIRASMSGTVERSGSAVIPNGLLPDILKMLPDEHVTMEIRHPGRVDIHSGSTTYNIHVLDAQKYPLPEVPFLDDTVPVSKISTMARQTLFAAGAGDQPNIMKAVRLKVGPAGLTATSTNGFCIADAVGDKNCVSDVETHVLIPARSLAVLASISLDSDVYQMGLTQGNVVFWSGTTMFSARVLEGRYPDTDNVLSRVKSLYSVSVDAADLYNAISAVSALGESEKEAPGRGELRFGEHELIVGVATADKSASIPVKAMILSPAPGPFYYNYKHLQRYLRLQRGRITLEIDQAGLLSIRTGEMRYLQSHMRPPKLSQAGKAA